MRISVAIAVALLAASWAGCTGTTPGHQAFDGDAALAFVVDIVYDGDGLRPRAPGMEGHAETADWLLGQMDVPGWSLQTRVYAGSEYLAADKGGAQAWSTSCSDEDRDQIETMTFRNLVARWPPAAPTDRTLVLAAHWDQKEDAHGGGPVPGANDGASGVGLLLQLQRHIQQNGMGFPYDLSIVFFDGEDGFEDCHPLAGAILSARSDAWDGVDGRMILLDMIGDPDARFIRESTSEDADADLMQIIWDKAPGHGLSAQFTDRRRSITDDHVPFIEEGWPAVDIIDAGRPATFPPYWHTSQDTPDKLSAAMLGAMGDLLLDVMQDPALVDPWPSDQ